VLNIADHINRGHGGTITTVSFDRLRASILTHLRTPMLSTAADSSVKCFMILECRADRDLSVSATVPDVRLQFISRRRREAEVKQRN
jgi:hypothetical protein